MDFVPQRGVRGLAPLLLCLFAVSCAPNLHSPVPTSGTGNPAVEQRNEVTYLRAPYNFRQFYRNNDSYRYSAAFHFHHGKQHDLLMLRPFAQHAQTDAEFDAQVFDFVKNKRAFTEPTMEVFGPYTATFAWRVYNAIDWTHIHHEQTYDIMADADIPWSQKKEWTDRAVAYYLHKNAGVARSIAPLDITMRRAGTMMKPYFTYYRTYYPKSNSQAWVAHWWHPAIYEAQMLGGNGPGQEQMLAGTNATMFRDVYADRPKRMLLSREMMPRYARMSPESANIFDNLHMLHGLVYDILAYPKWTPGEKRAELYRMIDAMSYRPGDERYVRKFKTPHPDVDPRVYEPWMRGTEGEMNRIMMEMHEEMMPLMMPEGKTMTPEMRQHMMDAMKKKFAPGMEEGETEGSLHDAMMAVMPDMKMNPEDMKPGVTPRKMVDAMLKGWEEKYGNLPDIDPMDMSHEPTAAPPLNPATEPAPVGHMTASR